MTDDRPFSTAVPGHADVYAALLDFPQSSAAIGPAALKPFEEPFAEAIPSHNNEPGDVSAARKYSIQSGGRTPPPSWIANQVNDTGESEDRVAGGDGPATGI